MLRKALIVVAALSVLGAVLWACARPAYRHWQERHALAQAQQFVLRGDLVQASLCARRAFVLNPASVEACRCLVGTAEAAGPPGYAAALRWQKCLVELDPNPENQLRLAALALQVEPPPSPTAAQALEDAATHRLTGPGWHVLSAQLALQNGERVKAERHFENACALEPGNIANEFNLAVLRLGSTNSETAAHGRAGLETLADHGKMGLPALRWLTSTTAATGPAERAIAYAARLAARPDAEIEDLLTYAGLLRQRERAGAGPASNESPLPTPLGAAGAGFEEYLPVVQSRAATNPAAIYAVAHWMIAEGLEGAAAAWVGTLPEPARSELPVELAAAECLCALRQWTSLEALAERASWGDGEFMRRAYLSRAAAGMSHGLAADAQWRLAIRETCQFSNNLAGSSSRIVGRAQTLVSLANQWGWLAQRDALLWELAGLPTPVQLKQAAAWRSWALRELEKSYSAEGNTAGLARVYEALVAAEPGNIFAGNNLAAVWLLLGRNLERAHALAFQLYEAHPGEAVLAATRAYSLHLQGRTQDGLALLDSLKPQARESGPVAFYYGLLLRASGRDATRYLAAGAKGSLLPEERKLLAQRQGGG